MKVVNNTSCDAHAGRGFSRPAALKVAALVAIGVLGAAGAVGAGTTTLDGQFASQENGCLHVAGFYYRVDCGYTDERKRQNASGARWLWVGPTSNPVYYAPEALEARPSYTPVAGDSRRALWATAQVTVDTGGTATPADDRIAADIRIGPGARNVATRIDQQTGQSIRVVESWSALRHTLAPTPVTGATPNAAGGVDYVIAARGFPTRLCRREAPADCFPSANAVSLRAGAEAENTWSNASPMSLGRGAYLGDNPGATTTAELTGYRCVDSAGGAECRASPLVWGARPNPGFDNLLLRVATDRDGQVSRLQAFWTREFHLGGGPARLALPATEANSWLGGYVEFDRRRNFGAGSP